MKKITITIMAPLLCILISSCSTYTLGDDEYLKMMMSPKETPIASEFSDAKKINYLKKELCGNLADEACFSLIGKTAWGRLEERYYLADDEKVLQKCSAYPVECKDIFYLELLFGSIHNQGVVELKKSHMTLDYEKRQRAIKALSDSHRAPVSTTCTPGPFGSMNCTSR